MFPQQPLNPLPAYSMGVSDDELLLRNQALSLYSAMLKKGKWNRVIHSLRRMEARLLDRQSSISYKCALNKRYIGVQSVAIDRIQGSEGRIEDFDNAFNPIHNRSRRRWLSVATMRLAGEALPPVELIQNGGIYFVRDGHHRISVAKALGEKYIDAEVTRESC
jgi:hypothetical protein